MLYRILGMLLLPLVFTSCNVYKYWSCECPYDVVAQITRKKELDLEDREELKIYGKVKNFCTKKALDDINVYIDDTLVGTVDASGQFELDLKNYADCREYCLIHFSFRYEIFTALKHEIFLKKGSVYYITFYLCYDRYVMS